MRDSQTEAGTAKLALGAALNLFIALKYQFDLIWGNTNARVLHGKADPAAPIVRRNLRNIQAHFPFRGKLDGIAQQIEQNLTD